MTTPNTTQRLNMIEASLEQIIAALNPARMNSNAVAETQPEVKAKGKAKRRPVDLTGNVALSAMPAHIAALLTQPIPKPTQPVVSHDVTVNFAETVTQLAPLCLEGLKAGKFNGKVIPFGINDPDARPARVDYRVYLETPANRRFKADRKASGVPMLDACIALADAVEALVPAK